MSNVNQLLYFVSQSYRQVQLSVNKGTEAYPHSAFANQFSSLLDASGDEDYARQLTIQLVEEAAKYNQTTDYLRQEMAFEIKVLTIGDRAMAATLDQSNFSQDLYNRRVHRQTKRESHPVAELV
ncbi:hypothetical protein GO730_13865 [Spirosoma sp. HMF3257]|uniref:Uncharacterized protein n=1 Tax=Spirosoma telluris TaxID=2183553 RepID=A0A327NLY3_9BACT|nr:hypothetical protein [Spirosoma telluris]RAI75026.1 hypothetical protein HMF3257_13780 [Spirosoma telluris]